MDVIETENPWISQLKDDVKDIRYIYDSLQTDESWTEVCQRVHRVCGLYNETIVFSISSSLIPHKYSNFYSFVS